MQPETERLLQTYLRERGAEPRYYAFFLLSIAAMCLVALFCGYVLQPVDHWLRHQPPPTHNVRSSSK